MELLLENKILENENEKLENENQIFRLRLPPELLAEMHKCLPLAAAIHVLVNVPSRAIYQNNSPRMRRTVQRLKTSLKEYIGTLVNEERDFYPEHLRFSNADLEWKPEFDVLLRYGTWLTSRRIFSMDTISSIVGMPQNFMEKLLLHMSNSRYAEMMLQSATMAFRDGILPIPTVIKPLFNENKQYQIDERFLFESIDLAAEDGQILHIFDGELYEGLCHIELRLFVANKMDSKNWFEIQFSVDPSSNFVRRFHFRRWVKQTSDEVGKFELGWLNFDRLKQIGNKLEAIMNIQWNPNLDMFLRRGAGFTQFRHLNIKEQYYLYQLPEDYADFLISYISSTKHPEEFFESIDINLDYDFSSFSSIRREIWDVCHKGGKFIHFDKKKLHILSAKTAKPEKKFFQRSFSGGPLFLYFVMQFTLANEPTNGAYLFDVDIDVQLSSGSDKIVGIKIQRRKVENIIGMKQHEIDLGKKRKAANEDEDVPTYSGKIMKK